MDENEIIDFLVNNESKYNFLGIRGDDKEIKIGDILDCSDDMTDDAEPGSKLDGTSAFCLTDCWNKDIVKNQIDSFLENYGSYDNISIVTGTSYNFGNDENEIEIKNCKIIATWENK